MKLKPENRPQRNETCGAEKKEKYIAPRNFETNEPAINETLIRKLSQRVPL